MIEQRLFATIRDLEYEVEKYKVYSNQLENEIKKFDNQKTENMNDKIEWNIESDIKNVYAEVWTSKCGRYMKGWEWIDGKKIFFSIDIVNSKKTYEQ